MFEEIKWSKKYEIGIEEIDLQHHYFVDLINRLSHELRATEDRKRQQRLLSELTKYAHFHFMSEENIMYEIQYPALEQHVVMHSELLETLSKRIGMLQEELEDVEEILQFLKQWFLSHSQGEDRKLTAFLKSRATEANES